MPDTTPPHDLPIRPRRNRHSPAIRDMVRETALSPADLIYPCFVIDGKGAREPIASMPGIARLSIDLLTEEVRQLQKLGVRGVALFPALPDKLKDSKASESTNPDGLLQRTVKALKDAAPEVAVITDVAMDPYSSDGHDGVVRDGQILNDETLDILAAMAVSQAHAGADIVAPSDMMDGRVGVLRRALDQNGFTGVGILSYSVKYASSYYGPFRDALDSAPKFGDKKTYQMDYANTREALREVKLDIEEGADMVMVKPAGPYLDVIAKVRAATDLPVAAYQVSGEFAMIRAVAEKGWMNGEALMAESLTGIKRAGADLILTYFAKEMAQKLNG